MDKDPTDPRAYKELSPQLSRQLDALLAERLREFLRTATGEESLSGDLPSLVDDVVLWGKGMLFEVECLRKEQGAIRQSSKNPADELKKMEEGLDQLKKEKEAILLDLRDLKQRRRNKRRRRR